jgi:L-amino acid N-acyltransferase YncA
MATVSHAAQLQLAPMSAGDWPAARAIYAEGIATGAATFEMEPPSWEQWDAAHLAQHRLVARHDQTIVGWAALSPVSDRCAYAGVTEDSVYVAAAVRGLGVGTALLRALIAGTDPAKIWTIQAGILTDNIASIRLHEACGFRVVGTRERIGRLDGRWRDVVLLERRAP